MFTGDAEWFVFQRGMLVDTKDNIAAFKVDELFASHFDSFWNEDYDCRMQPITIYA